MFTRIQRIAFCSLAVVALIVGACGVAPAEGAAADLSVDTILVRIGLVYLAYLCALLALDLSPVASSREGTSHTK